MTKKIKSTRALTAKAALSALRDFWLSASWLSPCSLTIEQVKRAKLACQKLLADNVGPDWSANQDQQLRKLKRFYEEAAFGPALTTSSKRLDAALCVAEWQWFSKYEEKKNVPGLSSVDVIGDPEVARKFAQAVFTSDLEAWQKQNDQYFSDVALAMRFQKRRSELKLFLAEYSLLMFGNPPVLTFGDLCKMFDWMEPVDLRKEIRKVRRKYGHGAVPLKRGRPGRPSKLKNRG